MLWIVAVLLLLVAVAYFFTYRNKNTNESSSEDTYEPQTAYVPQPNEPNYYQQQQKTMSETIAPATTTPGMPVLTSASSSTTPPSSSTGLFEMNAKGDTGSEKITVTIDGIRYPEQGTYDLSTNLQTIRIETPRKVDLANVTLKDMSPPHDANGVDTNIRIASIYVNGSKENVRSRLYQSRERQDYISNGLWFWGGELSFQSAETTGLEPSAQGKSTVPSTSSGSIEIAAKGDVGNEQIRVVVDGMTYPSPAGALNDDGTVSPGAYVIPTGGTKIVVKTPRRVDLANVIIKYINDAIDPDTQKDRNVRVQSILINGDGQNVRARLFKVGLDDVRLASLRADGGMFWGGDYTFV